MKDGDKKKDANKLKKDEVDEDKLLEDKVDKKDTAAESNGTEDCTACSIFNLLDPGSVTSLKDGENSHHPLVPEGGHDSRKTNSCEKDIKCPYKSNIGRVLPTPDKKGDTPPPGSWTT